MAEKEENVSNDPYFSTLRQMTISNEKVDLWEKVYKEQGMKTFGDYGNYYNDWDAISLVEGIAKMQKFYHDQGLNMFKDAVSHQDWRRN